MSICIYTICIISWLNSSKEILSSLLPSLLLTLFLSLFTPSSSPSPSLLRGGTELLTSTPTKKKHSIQLPSQVSSSTPLISNSSKDDLPEPSITTPTGQSTSSPAPKEAERPVDVRFLVQWIRKNLIVEREELFLDGETV